MLAWAPRGIKMRPQLPKHSRLNKMKHGMTHFSACTPIPTPIYPSAEFAQVRGREFRPGGKSDGGFSSHHYVLRCRIADRHRLHLVPGTAHFPEPGPGAAPPRRSLTVPRKVEKPLPEPVMPLPEPVKPAPESVKPASDVVPLVVPPAMPLAPQPLPVMETTNSREPEWKPVGGTPANVPRRPVVVQERSDFSP